MNFILTLIAADNNLTAAQLTRAAGFAAAEKLGPGDAEAGWLDQGVAARLALSQMPDRAQMDELHILYQDERIDVLVTPAQNRQKRLLIADMDSTIVTGETLDELAALAGLEDQVAPITAQAMRGELDFEQALRARVALLAGLPENMLLEVLSQTALTEGAAQLTGVMRAHGASCVLVSGGFTDITGPVARVAGFSAHHGNVLEVENGKLTGRVIEPILGKEAKLDYLRSYRDQLRLRSEDVLAIGDGANDLPMLEEAGLGIGFRPKPLLRQRLLNCLFYCNLRAVLYAQGYKGLR